MPQAPYFTHHTATSSMAQVAPSLLELEQTFFGTSPPVTVPTVATYDCQQQWNPRPPPPPLQTIGYPPTEYTGTPTYNYPPYTTQ